MPRLVAFDLDGTLVDSRLDIAASANRLLIEIGAEPLPDEQIAGMVGEGARTLVRRLVAAAGVEVEIRTAFERFLAIYDEHLVDHTRLYPGVAEALEMLAGRGPMAILTNKPQHHTDRLLEALGIRQRFMAALGGDTSFPRKPDPAALVHLAHLAGASIADTVMVGDSIVDLETARRAGSAVCLVTYGFGRFEPEAIASLDVCHRPEDLGALVAAMLDRDSGTQARHLVR